MYMCREQVCTCVGCEEGVPVVVLAWQRRRWHGREGRSAVRVWWCRGSHSRAGRGSERTVASRRPPAAAAAAAAARLPPSLTHSRPATPALRAPLPDHLAARRRRRRRAHPHSFELGRRCPVQKFGNLVSKNFWSELR